MLVKSGNISLNKVDIQWKSVNITARRSGGRVTRFLPKRLRLHRVHRAARLSLADTINNLPENIRKQLFLLIQQSLPLIDTSINWYITHIDLVLKDNVSQVIDHMSCNLHGVLENYKDSIGASLASLFIKSDNSGKLVPINIPATISALEKAISDTRNNVHPDTTSRKIRLGYADLLHYAAVVTCKAMATNDPLPVRIELQQQVERLSTPALVWTVLDSVKFCSTPSECVQKRRSYVEGLLTSEGAKAESW
jgi:hypothetical protein